MKFKISYMKSGIFLVMNTNRLISLSITYWCIRLNLTWRSSLNKPKLFKYDISITVDHQIKLISLYLLILIEVQCKLDLKLSMELSWREVRMRACKHALHAIWRYWSGAIDSQLNLDAVWKFDPIFGTEFVVYNWNRKGNITLQILLLRESLIKDKKLWLINETWN